MKHSRFSLAIAFAALGLSQGAAAQRERPPEGPCIDQADVSDATVYATPILLETFRTRCATELRADGFMAREGSALISKYEGMQEQSWSGTRRFFAAFAGNPSGTKGDAPLAQFGDMIGEMPDEILRPMVSFVIKEQLGPEIKLEDCRKIERGVELLSPLPPKNMGGALALIIELAEPRRPAVCPFEAEQAAP